MQLEDNADVAKVSCLLFRSSGASPSIKRTCTGDRPSPCLSSCHIPPPQSTIVMERFCHRHSWGRHDHYTRTLGEWLGILLPPPVSPSHNAMNIAIVACGLVTKRSTNYHKHIHNNYYNPGNLKGAPKYRQNTNCLEWFCLYFSKLERAAN